MQRFMSAHASGPDSRALLTSCLGQLGKVPAEASLGFLYATAALVDELPQLLEALRQHMPRVHWLGNVGEGICAAGVEYYDEPSLSLLLTDIPQENYCLLPTSAELFTPIPLNVMQWCERNPDCFGVLHGVPTHIASGSYASEIRELAPEASLSGGLSSGRGFYRHIDNEVLEHGISGVLFSSRQPILCDLSQGCTPISDTFSIDESQQNMVLQLDNRPALDVLRDVVGEVLWRDKRRIGNFIFAGLPTGNGDDYLVRNLMGLDLDGGAIAVGDLMERHSQLRFCRRDGNAARDDLVAMLQRMKKQLAGRTIRGGLYVSCVGRGRHQFGNNSEELKMIHTELGEFPLAGYFANGEFFNGRLYSYTGVLTLFL